MSTVYSPSPASLGLNTGAPTAPQGFYRVRRRADGTRGLAALLLAAVVSALVVLADQMINTWADGHLFLGWVALWVVIFAGTALFAGTARRVAQRTLRALDAWSRSMAEARAEVRLWELAKLDPRLKAELVQAREVDDAEPPAPVVTTFSDALAPLGMDLGTLSAATARRFAQLERRRQAGFLPYL